MLINVHIHDLAAILVPNIACAAVCVRLILSRIGCIEPTWRILGVFYGQGCILVASLPCGYFGSIHWGTCLLAFNLIVSRLLHLLASTSIVDNVYLVAHNDRCVSILGVTSLHLLTLVMRMVLRGCCSSDWDSTWRIHQTSRSVRLNVRISILSLPSSLITLNRLTSNLFTHRQMLFLLLIISVLVDGITCDSFVKDGIRIGLGFHLWKHTFINTFHERSCRVLWMRIWNLTNNTLRKGVRSIQHWRCSWVVLKSCMVWLRRAIVMWNWPILGIC